MIRVLIADDQALVRAGFGLILGSDPELMIVGEVADGVEALAAARETQPDVVVMDIRMPRMDGIEATRHLTSAASQREVRVLVLTTFDDDEYVAEALRAGASGFVLKDTAPADLIAAVKIIAAGESLLAPALTRRLIERFVRGEQTTAGTAHGSTIAADLTPRESAVLRAVARGLSNHEIAAELFVSYSTVKTHVSHLLTKLEARDRAQLVMIAYRSGLADVEG